MRKAILISALIMLFTISAQSQVGVGARGLFKYDGNAYGGLELSIQKINKYELDLGFSGDSWKATGLKLFPFIERKRVGLYGGAGMGVGYYSPEEDIYGTLAFDIGAFMRIGRLQLGLDWRPEYNFSYPPDSDLSFSTALSARWVFGKKF